MTIRPIPCYEVACDAKDCKNVTGTYGDFSGYGDWGHAVDDWIDADGQEVNGGPGRLLGGKHYCWDHRLPECCGCDETADLTQHDGDQYCQKCLAPSPTTPSHQPIEETKA